MITITLTEEQAYTLREWADEALAGHDNFVRKAMKKARMPTKAERARWPEQRAKWAALCAALPQGPEGWNDWLDDDEDLDTAQVVKP